MSETESELEIFLAGNGIRFGRPSLVGTESETESESEFESIGKVQLVKWSRKSLTNK